MPAQFVAGRQLRLGILARISGRRVRGLSGYVIRRGRTDKAGRWGKRGNIS